MISGVNISYEWPELSRRRDGLLVATDIGIPRRRVLVEIVLGLQEALDLVYGPIKLDPLLVGRLRNAMPFNARRL